MPGRDKSKFDWSDQKEVLPSPEGEAGYAGYARQMALGVAQGAGDVAMLAGLPGAGVEKLMGAALGESGEERALPPGEEARYKGSEQEGISEWQKLQLLQSDDDIMPPQTMPGGRARMGEAIEQIPEEGNLQEATRRVTRSIPGALGGPALFAEMGTRELMGLGGKKIAEQMGMGETAQQIFDTGFSLAPNPKKFIEGGSKLISKAATGEYTTQQQMLEGARKLGFSEQEIAPLVREGWFGNLLKKMSPRGQATELALDKTAKAVTSGFEHIKDSREALKFASQPIKNRFVSEVERALPDLTEKAKKAIGPELETLYAGEMKGRDFVSFWQKLNRYYKELPELQSLKGPTGRAIKGISPALSQDFEMANTLSNRFRTVSKGMKPNLLSQLVTAGEIVGGLTSMLSLQLPIAAAGVAGGRKLAELMTTNPRFINMHRKMLTSINTGQAKAAEKIMDNMITMVSRENPQAAAEIRKTSMKELRELLQAASIEEDLDQE